MTKYKACKDCKYFDLTKHNAICRRQRDLTIFDPIDGIFKPGLNYDVFDERSDDDKCSIEAKYFVQKDQS